MRKHLFPLLFLVLAALLGGCGSIRKMAFADDAATWTQTGKSVLLLTVNVKNSYKTSFQPKVLYVHVEKRGAQDDADQLAFKLDDKAKMESDDPATGNNYLMRLELDPGTYELRNLSTYAQKFLVTGYYYVPLHAEIVVDKPGVYYLGHVNATVRERQGDEFRAGPSFPLLDQAIAGASSGSFDVEFMDEFAKDEALFRASFPALAGVTITKSILPQFDRAKAQKHWEMN